MPPASQILDQWGVPISPAQIARLRTHQGGPRITSPRSPFSVYQPTDRLKPASLGAILGQARVGNSLAYMELLEEIEEKETHFSGVLGIRKKQVSQLPVRVKASEKTPDGERHATFIRDWLETGTFEAALPDMLDGISKGYAVLEKLWLTRPGKVWPVHLAYRPQRYFEVDWRDGNTILLRESYGYAPLAQHKFLVHRHPSKSGNILRSGLGHAALWCWMYKQFTMQDWAVFAHNYGAPIRIGRYGPESTNEDRGVLWRAVSNIAGDMAAIIPRSMEVEFIHPQGLGDSAELYERRARYLDEQLSKLVLGQVATTDAIAGGHAVGKVHHQVQEVVEKSDARLLAMSANRQLIPEIIAFNFGPQPAYPCLEIGWEDEIPLKELVEGVKGLAPLGLRVKAAELYDRMNLTAPDGAENDVIGGRAPAAPPAEGAAPEASGGASAPRPETQPAARAALRNLARLQLQAAGLSDAPDVLDALTDRLAEDGAGALSGLTSQVLMELQAATSMPDLAQRLAGLRLDPRELAEVIGRNLALANLVGQAAVAGELRG